MNDRASPPETDDLIAKRRERIIELRESGLTFRQIGDELGVTAARAGKLHQLGLRDRQVRRAATAQEEADLDTPSAHLGFDPHLTFALAHLGLSNVRLIVGRTPDELARALLRYPNVNRRSLTSVLELRRRFTVLGEEPAAHLGTSGRTSE